MNTTEVKAFAKKHNLSEAHAQIVLREEAKKTERIQKAREKAAKHPHALVGQVLKTDIKLPNGKIVAKKGDTNPDTLVYDEEKGKFKVKIRCVISGDTNRYVFTSDLHQVNMTEKAYKANKAQARKAKAEETKAALEAYRKNNK